MRQKIASRVTNLAESATLAMAQKSRELKEQGLDIISLGVGEPDFDTPDFIKAAAKKAIDDNYSHYSPVPGYPILRKAIANKLKRDNKLDYEQTQICVSNGAKHSLANALQALVEKDDEVIIPAPYWVTYVELVTLSEGKSVIIEAGVENDFKITSKQLEQAISPKTKVFLFNSPSNPTGSVYTKEELESLVEVLDKHPDIIVISDEIYEYITYGVKHTSIAEIGSMKERTVVINGVSKAYAMTGYRIGYTAAPTWISKAMIKLQGQYTSGPNSVAQICSAEAINSDNSEVTKMVHKFKERRDLVLEKLAEIPKLKTSIPEGAFYVFPDVSAYFGKSDGTTTITNADDLSMHLLNKAHIGVVSGSAFGADKCLRISYAASEEQLLKAMSRMKDAMLALK
ncbi:MAG: pyridoxal phosphate-dependent aminotransferase [Bacteroidales bacterium]